MAPYINKSKLKAIAIFLILVIVVLYVCHRNNYSFATNLFRTEPYESYQCTINKINRENEIVKDRYQHQNVSQSSIPQQQKDYAASYKLPQEMASNYQKIFPDDLLPKEKETTDWQRANPPGTGSLELKNMLEAGTHVGVNTQGSSMKNANHQLRSEPPNPIIPVSIWRNSSITPDMYRKELEIGESTTK